MTSLFGWCPVLYPSVNGANSDLCVCESLTSCGGTGEGNAAVEIWRRGEMLLKMVKSQTLGSRANHSWLPFDVKIWVEQS